jgi:hypothetical protein
MALLYGRAGRLTAKNGDFRPGTVTAYTIFHVLRKYPVVNKAASWQWSTKVSSYVIVFILARVWSVINRGVLYIFLLERDSADGRCGIMVWSRRATIYNTYIKYIAPCHNHAVDSSADGSASAAG